MKPLPLLTLTILFLTSCEGLLYHPDSHDYKNLKPSSYQPESLVIHEDLAKNEKLTAWHFKTLQESKGVIVVFHGNAQNVTSHYTLMYWVLDKGYDLFIFDYPGFGESLGKPNTRNTVESGALAIDYVRKKWPRKPYIIVGQSIGGITALKTLADLQDRSGICAVVIDSSFLSYQEIGRDVLSRSWLTWPFQWISYVLLSDKYAPNDDVKKISPIPLLVMHRKNDPVIPVEFGKEIYEKAGDPKELILLGGQGHDNAFTQADALQNQEKFLKFLNVCEKNFVK